MIFENRIFFKFFKSNVMKTFRMLLPLFFVLFLGLTNDIVNPVGRMLSEVKTGRSFFNYVLEESLKQGSAKCLLTGQLWLDTGDRKEIWLTEEKAYAVVRLLKESNIRRRDSASVNHSRSVSSRPSVRCALEIVLDFPESGKLKSEITIYIPGLVQVCGEYASMDREYVDAIAKLLKEGKKK